jgi:anti-anti-sigma factor
MNATINIEVLKDYVIMQLEGDFNSSDENDYLLNSFRDLAKKGYKAILVNLTKVIYLNSGSIGVLLSGNAMLKKKDSKIVLFGASDYLDNIFNVTRLNLAIDICRTMEEAVESVK